MLIIALHQFDTEDLNQPYRVSRAYLEQIISGLGTEFCKPLNDSTLINPENKSWALSVDDGYISDIKLWEFCKSLKIPLTSFINTSNLNKKGFISVNEMRDLVADGMEIGSHSHNHRDLTSLNRIQILSEIKHSKIILEEILQRHINKLAFPWGRNNYMVRRVAREAGIKFAFSTTSKSFSKMSPSLCIPRLALTENAHIRPKNYSNFYHHEHYLREPIRLTLSILRKI